MGGEGGCSRVGGLAGMGIEVEVEVEGTTWLWNLCGVCGREVR